MLEQLTLVQLRQSLPPSISATLTPLASLLSSVMPHLTLPSVSHSNAHPSTPSNSVSTTYQQKPPTVKSNQPFFITMLTNQIKKCGALFRELSGLQSAYILGHMERDWFPQFSFTSITTGFSCSCCQLEFNSKLVKNNSLNGEHELENYHH